MRGKHLHIWQIFYCTLGLVTHWPNYHSKTVEFRYGWTCIRSQSSHVTREPVSWDRDRMPSVRSVDTPPYKQAPVIASSTDDEAIPAGEADVGQVGRVAQKTLVFGKFLWTGKVEQLYHSKVIACHDVEAGVRHTSAGYVCLICVPGPDPHHLIP